MVKQTLSDEIIITPGNADEGKIQVEAVKQFIKDVKEILDDNLVRVCYEEFQLERYQSLDETLKKLKLKIEGQVEMSLKELAGEKLI